MIEMIGNIEGRDGEDSIVTDVSANAQSAFLENLEYELKAAYRMDYDYLHVYHDHLQADTFMFSLHVHASDYEAPYMEWEGFTYSRSYDLREEHLTAEARHELRS
jgi:hypothetical protein